MSLTFMAKFNEREGNSCHIHLSLRSPDGEPVLAGDGEHGFSPLMEHFLAGQLACLRELTLLSRAQHQLVQALRRRQLRPDRRSPGASTTAPAPCGWSATASACGSRAGCRAATSTPTWRWPRWWPPACTASRTSCALEPAYVGNAYLDGPTPGAADAAGRGRSVRREQGGPGGVRRRRGRRTTSTPPGWSWLPSMPPSPTGSCAVGSSASDTPLPRIGLPTYVEPARWGVWDRPAALLPQSYVAAVAGAGGLPVLLPPVGPRTRPAGARRLDALVLTGGADVDPSRYGAERTPPPSRPGPTGTRGRRRWSPRPSPGTCRCWPCAGAPRC